MKQASVEIKTDKINLDQFLKWAGAVDTGGQAKNLISSGLVMVNGQIENRRGRQLIPGDEVVVESVGRFIVSRPEE